MEPIALMSFAFTRLARRLTPARRLATTLRAWLLACLAMLCLAGVPAVAADGDASGLLKTAAGSDPADDDFLAKIAHQPGMVALPGGGQAHRLSEGSGASGAGAKEVVINLSRRGLREPRADNPSMVQNARYRTSALPPALNEALQLMHVGDRWEVFAPPFTPPNRGARLMPASAFTVDLVAAH